VPDELDLLRELGRDGTEPDPGSVARARRLLERRIGVRPASWRRLWRLRLAKPAVALVLALGVGAGFGLSAWLSPSGSATSSFLGFGFLPAKGWTVVQSGTVGATGTAHAIAANVALDSEDRSSDLPYATLRRLPPSGAVIVARLFPRGNESRDASFPLRTLPLRLADAEEGDLPRGLSRTSLVSLTVRGAVAGYDVDAQVFLGGPPSPARLAAVDEQLRRLVVAPGGVTLVVQPTIFSDSNQRMTIFGSVSSGRANEKVTIQFKACGLLPVQFRDAFETTTNAGGGFSLAELRPFNLGVSGVFRAVSGDQVSADVRVQQRASVSLRPLRGGRFWASAYGRNASFWHRYVLIQRFARARGVWITMRRLVLTETVNTNWYRTRAFRPVVPKGTSIRAVFPLSQARPCYLAGYSKLWRT
jgi:hypothetical protein